MMRAPPWHLNFVRCLFALLLLVAMLPVAHAVSSDQVTLQLKWRHQFQFAGYYAALEKGYFADVGLDVLLREASPEMDVGSILVEGGAQYAIESPGLLVRRGSGAPIVVVAAIFQHSPTVILARTDSGIRGPQDLVGRKLMGLGSDDPEVRAMLEAEGVSRDKYLLLPHSWNVEDLISGRVDAMSAYITNEPFLLKLRGVEPRVIHSKDYMTDFYGDCLYTTRQEAERKPARVEKMLKAVKRGWKYAFEHEEEIIELLTTRLGSPKSREMLRYEARMLRELVRPGDVEIGHMNPTRWERIAEIYERQGMLPKGFSTEGFLFVDLVERSARENAERLQLALGLLALAGAVGAASITFNVLLRRQVRSRTRDLAQSEKRYRQLYESMRDAFLCVDLEGRLLEFNSAFCDLLGRSPESLKGGTLRELTPARWYDEEQRIFREQVLPDGFSEVYEKEWIRSDGDVVPVEMRAHLIRDDRGGPRFIWGIVRDVSQRKQAEVQLRNAKERAENAVRAKSDFLARMSHEIRTPLTSIVAISEMLSVKWQSAEERAFIDALGSASNMLLAVVNDILDFSRMELGIIRLEQSAFDLFSTLDEVRLLFEPSASRKGLRFDVTIAPSVPRLLWGDSFRLKQILGNLVSNAIKFTEQGGVSVAVSREPGQGVSLAFTVSDSGIGIDSASLEKIFEPFVQAEESTSRRFGGTGLGLAICARLAELLGGSLTVSSLPGQGSVFRLRAVFSDAPPSSLPGKV